MGIDKFKIATTIKLCMLALYFMYFIFFNTSLHIYLPAFKNNDALLKEKIISDSCLLILGGSNVRQGISAQLLSDSLCPTLNLGIDSELGFFNSYQDWLAKNLKNRKFNNVLYSPGIFWSDKSITNDDSDSIAFPSTPILSQLRNIFIDRELIFNSLGDVESYYCNSEVASFNLNEVNFSIFTSEVTQEIKRRVSVLENMASTDNVFVRVPPIYVKTKRQAERYTELMNERIRALKRLGVKILDTTTIVSTNGTLFCDSYHPNAKGREVFSREIELP